MEVEDRRLAKAQVTEGTTAEEDKMEDEEYMSASTTEERDSVLNECSKVSEWLDEEAGMFTPVDEFNTKLKVVHHY